MSFLFFDYDGSTASIGGHEGVEEHLGVPPIEMDKGVTHFRKTIKRLITIEYEEKTHPVLGDEGAEKEPVMKLGEKAVEHDIQGIVVDSVTRLADHELDATRERMNQQRKDDGEDPLDNLSRTWWGNYGTTMKKLYRLFSKLPMTVVVTAHEAIEKDEVGKRYHTVDHKGSSNDSLQEFFDVVGYLGLEGDGHDKDRFIRVADAPAYPQAKDRKQLLHERVPFVEDGELIDGTLAAIVNKYRENGIEHPTIALIGQSGTGKTLLTSTLAPLV